MKTNVFSKIVASWYFSMLFCFFSMTIVPKINEITFYKHPFPNHPILKTHPIPTVRLKTLNMSQKTNLPFLIPLKDRRYFPLANGNKAISAQSFHPFLISFVKPFHQKQGDTSPFFQKYRSLVFFSETLKKNVLCSLSSFLVKTERHLCYFFLPPLIFFIVHFRHAFLSRYGDRKRLCVSNKEQGGHMLGPPHYYTERGSPAALFHNKSPS